MIPIAKSWPSQFGVAANDLASQVLGGAGYTRDFDIEQALSGQPAEPDQRRHTRNPGDGSAWPQGTRGRGSGTPAAAGQDGACGRRRDGPEGKQFGGVLITALGEVTAVLGGLGDPGAVLADSTLYLEACGQLVVAWLWLEQWNAAAGWDGPFYEGKRVATRYFFSLELPRVDPMLDVCGTRTG